MQRAAPLDDGIAVELARTRLIAARVHYFADTTLDESAPLNTSGLALLDGVLERQPENAIARFWRWTARVYQAQELLFERKPGEAVSLLDMLAIEAPTMQDDPEFPDYRLRVEADLHTIRGDALWEFDERSMQSLVAYQHAVAILERGKRGDGEELALDVALANALWSVAYAHAQLGQGAAALEASERAGALLDRVLGFGPDDWAEYVRGNVRTQRAVALQDLGRHREAALEFEKAYVSMLARAQRDPGVPNTIRTLAILTEPMGHNYLAMGQKNQGCSWLRRSLGYWAEIRQRWGVTPLDENWINGYGREFSQLCRGWGSTPEP
jgi:tetratricopeptide (TPR) repeat protein